MIQYHMYMQKYTTSERKYLNFNVIRYYIKLERQTKLKKNAYKKNYTRFYFILIDFFIKLYIGLFLIRLKIK